MFEVIDPATGRSPDFESVCREDWASHLCPCDLDQFYIGEDGSLALCDDCGELAFPPPGRFAVKWDGTAERQAVLDDAETIYDYVNALYSRTRRKGK